MKVQQLVITVKTMYGLEQALLEELNELGFSDGRVLNRAVQINGTWEDVYYLNLHLRCALMVLVEVASFRIKDDQDLYKKASKINWTEYFDLNKSFAIKGAVFSNLFSHSQYPYLLLKDAIVDCFRNETGERPNIQVKNPQVLFDLYIRDQEVTISLNSSGAPLYLRGYRSETGPAPINEVLAAGMIRLSGWDRKSTFIDPFCGSGTLLIEAAFLASGIPSNIMRQHYAFKNFKNYRATVWENMYNEAEQKARTQSLDASRLGFTLYGSDVDAEMIFRTKRNIRGLAFMRALDLKVASFEELKFEGVSSGVLMCNPPYGERLRPGEDENHILEMYDQLGSWFKKELSGFTAWIISSNFEALKHIGLKPARKFKLFNGDLECSFRSYELFSGALSDFKAHAKEA